MSLKLRPYQEESVDQTRQALSRHRSVLLQAPTGAGKTAMASFMFLSSQAKAKVSYFVCHRQELIDQTALTFEQVGLDFSYIAAGYPYDPTKSVQICSIGTLTRRLDKVPEPDLAVWDEAHHVAAKGWATVHEAWQGAYHVGLSATPERLDGRGLGSWFGELVLGPRVADLITAGWLNEYKAYGPDDPDLSGVKQRYGDYVKQQLSEACDKPAIIGSLVEHYRKFAEGKKAVVFAVDVKHSKNIIEQFEAAGIKAAHLDGKTPKHQRRIMLQRFARGQIDVISNVALFGEGFDLAANSGMDVHIEAVILARPTASLSMHLQMVGRALRPGDDPAIILDHAGNCLKHGLPDKDREWSLADREKKCDGVAPCRQCKQCFAILPAGTQVCPECGYEFPAQLRVGPEHKPGKLVEIEKARAARVRRQEQGQCQSYDSLVALGVQRGYKHPEGWASKIWQARVNRGPVKRFRP